MIIRLHRFFNLYRRSLWKNCAALGGLFLLLPMVILLLLDALHSFFVLPLLGLNLLGFLSLLLGYPARLELNGGVLSFEENYEVSLGERRRIHFHITQISDVEYLQSEFEKKHNIGRIRFRGIAEAEPAAALKGKTVAFFEICGIPDFDQLPKRLEELNAKSKRY